MMPAPNIAFHLVVWTVGAWIGDEEFLKQLKHSSELETVK